MMSLKEILELLTHRMFAYIVSVLPSVVGPYRSNIGNSPPRSSTSDGGCQDIVGYEYNRRCTV